jgi:hypothetical protein
LVGATILWGIFYNNLICSSWCRIEFPSSQWREPTLAQCPLQFESVTLLRFLLKVILVVLLNALVLLDFFLDSSLREAWNGTLPRSDVSSAGAKLRDIVLLIWGILLLFNTVDDKSTRLEEVVLVGVFCFLDWLAWLKYRILILLSSVIQLWLLSIRHLLDGILMRRLPSLRIEPWLLLFFTYYVFNLVLPTRSTTTTDDWFLKVPFSSLKLLLLLLFNLLIQLLDDRIIRRFVVGAVSWTATCSAQTIDALFSFISCLLIFLLYWLIVLKILLVFALEILALGKE